MRKTFLSLLLFTLACFSVVSCEKGSEGRGNGAAKTKTYTVNGVSFDMLKVKGGTFWMGAQDDDPNGLNYDADANSDEFPVHEVTLSDYYIGVYEVTQALWQAVMDSNPSYFQSNNPHRPGVFADDLSRPVEGVSWNDIVNDFLPKLNVLLKGQLGRYQFVLPTEAQWEYAARGGSGSQGYKYSGSNDIDAVAWYGGDWETGSTHPVGQKSPNELGLYDMSGNVYEWCSDWYGDYSIGSHTDPAGPTSGSYRVQRGGIWFDSARICRVSRRSYSGPDGGDYHIGFRLALVPSSH